MRHTLRSMERKLVRERTELGVQAVAHDLADRWQLALERHTAPPAPIDFPRMLTKAGIYVLTTPRAIVYLEECERAGSVPDPRRLLQKLLPWCPYGQV